MDGSIEEWMRQAIAYPGIEMLALTPQIAVSVTLYYECQGVECDYGRAKVAARKCLLFFLSVARWHFQGQVGLEPP